MGIVIFTFVTFLIYNDMIQERDYSISAIRCVAMCLIVLCHMMLYYNMTLAWWFNVGVQIFFFISGFLYSSKSIENPIAWIGKQFKKILLPYYVFLFVSFVLYVLFVPDISFTHFGGSIFCISTAKGIEHLWFIRYILFCYLITPYLYQLKLWLFTKSIKKALFYLLGIWIIYIAVSIRIYIYLNPIWISCYILGYFYGAYSNRISVNKLYCVNFLGVFSAIVLNAARIYVRYISTIQLDGISATVFNVCEYVSHMALGFALYVILYNFFKKVHYNKILYFSDRYSYDIYIVHQLFILSPFTLMNITSCHFLNWILVLFAIIISALLLNCISQFITNKLPGKVVRV